MDIKVENIKQFLTHRDWKEIKGSERFFNLKPPERFKFPEDFYLSIPKNTCASDFNRFIRKIAEIIADIYELNVDDLLLLFSKDNTIFSIKIEDDETVQGSISFPRFETIIENLKKLFTDIVSFVIYQEPFFDKAPPKEAERYVNLCNFLRVEPGSFVAKIQLPSDEVLRPKGFFDERELISEDVNEKLINFLNFVIHKGFRFEGYDVRAYWDEELINLKLLKDIHDLYKKSPLIGTKTRFTFLNARYEKDIESFETNLGNLSRFIEAVEERLFDVVSVDTKGLIVELKSRNPDKDQNTIVLTAIVNGVKTKIAVTLDKRDYRTAMKAHEAKRYVRIKGKAKKLKTRLRITELELFSLVER